MNSFLRAAIKVLELERRPLTAHEIVHEAVAAGLLKTMGKTPHKTLNARLSEHILENQHESIVMRIGQAEYGLRDWQQKVPEYIARRRKLNPIDEDVLAFPASRLSEFVRADGLNHGNWPLLKKVIESCSPIHRLKAEESFDVVQIISSFFITYRGKVLSYRRSKRLPEKRLHDAYSLIFGGHITFEDHMPLFGLEEKKLIQMFMRRELDEEVRFFPPPEIMHFKGIIYDSQTPIGRQHIGLVFHVPVKNSQYLIGERGFLLGDAFEKKSEIQKKLDQFDSWSRMIAREYLDGNW